MLYGCLPPKKDIRDFELCSANNPSIVYPTEFILSDLPKVKNQNVTNSCCSHATSSILEYHDHNNHTLSTNFIYGIQKLECGHIGQGMYLKDACKIVQKYGDLLEYDCPGNTEVPKCYSVAEESLKNDKAIAQAYQFRIDNYYLCRTNNDIKLALMNYGPVLGGVMWRDIYTMDKDYIIHFNQNTPGGGHCVMICGWSDSKQAWLIQNSWGDKWGDKGRFWLPYDYGLFEARCLIDHPNEKDITLNQPNKKTPRWMCKFCNFTLNLFKKHILLRGNL